MFFVPYNLLIKKLKKMKKVLLAMSLLVMVSCSKESTKPVTASLESNLISENVSFNEGVSNDVHLTPGINTLQSNSFDVTGTVYIGKFEFNVSNNQGQLGTNGFKFYIDGLQMPATISLSGNSITVAMRKAFALSSGTHTYIIQGKVLNGHSGVIFSMELTSAAIYNGSRISVPIDGLPQIGNTFTIN